MSIDTLGSGRMSPSITRSHAGGYLLAFGAAVALGITTWRYFTPLSGVTGTPGALLTMFGEAALLLAGVAISWMSGGTGRAIFIVLAWLGIILTGFAAYLLHGWWALTALAVALIGLAIGTVARSRSRKVST